MPLGTNPTFIQIRDFFGGSNNFRDYYRGGPYVPNIPANANISTDPNTLRQTSFSGADKASALSVSAPSVFNQVNNGTAAGSSTASGSGGAGGYTYTWSGGTSANMRVNGATASFSSTRSVSTTATVTVRDAAGATASRTISVELAVGRPL